MQSSRWNPDREQLLSTLSIVMAIGAGVAVWLEWYGLGTTLGLLALTASIEHAFGHLWMLLNRVAANTERSGL